MRKRKHSKGLSDSTLARLWRQAVKASYNNRCIICNAMGELECHHIVHRKIKVLRWDYNNGVPVCLPLKNNCHQFSDTLEGRDKVKKIIGEAKYNHIKKYEHIIFKDFIREANISENKWREQVKQELLDIIKSTSL